MSAAIELSPATGALVVHDVVNDFVDPARPGFDQDLPRVLDNIEVLLTAARQAGLPVIFIGPGQGDPKIGPRKTSRPPNRLVWGSPGVDVPDRFGPLPGETLLRKPRYGAFYGSRLAAHLRETGRDTIAVCGLSLAGGVENTIRDAFNHDLKSVLVHDATLCRAVPDQGWGAVSREEVAKVILSILAQRFARVVSVAEICDALAVSV
ncbi:MAG: cysteine hydrolase [Alphaproteobacteria bacterium]|nr:cysteine hydrolase [Alphaproteobacteria bacterium]